MAGRTEVFSGASATDKAWSGYAGAVVSFNETAKAEGWRLRLFASSGQYQYQSTKAYQSANLLTSEPFRTNFAVETVSGEAMLGYQMQVRGVWLKLYGGVHYESHDDAVTSLVPLKAGVDAADFLIPDGDPGNDYTGEALGAKLLIESWTRLSANGWISLDASFSTANQSFGAFSRLGVEISSPFTWLSGLTFGPELAAFGREADVFVKSGVFLGFDAREHNIAISAGLSGNYEDTPGVYGSVGLFRRF